MSGGVQITRARKHGETGRCLTYWYRVHRETPDGPQSLLVDVRMVAGYTGDPALEQGADVAVRDAAFLGLVRAAADQGLLPSASSRAAEPAASRR